MARKTTIVRGLGRLPSALLADGLGTPFDGAALTIEMIGLPSTEAFGRPKIRWAEPAYAGLKQIYIPRPIEVTLRGIRSEEFFGRLEVRLDLNTQSIEPIELFGQPGVSLNLKARNIRVVERFGKPAIIADRRFTENLEEEEMLVAFLLAA